METKTCQNCKGSFVVDQEDFNFYEKMQVPAPTWCPECRMIRRFAAANAWSLFWRNCDKCQKRMLSVHSPSQKLTVYCQPCWWADSWDGTEYAMGYDSSRPFLAQLMELSEKTPYSTLETEYLTNKNCEYSNALAYSKDCTLTIWADYCESVYYSSILNTLKHSADCLRGFHSELCYECVGVNKSYQNFFSYECRDCVNVWFSRNCSSCTNCIGCVNLRGASYCIFNVKYSKEEYEKKVKELKLDSWQALQDLAKKAHEFWMSKPYREYNGNSKNLNVTGEDIYSSKNSKEMYMAGEAENCKWCQFLTVKSTKDSYDYSGWGNNVDLLYECAGVGNGMSNGKFSSYCFPDGLNFEYCLWCIAPKNNFGCVNLKRKPYCILNKQYSKEEYEKLKGKIIEDMKNNPYIDDLGRAWTYGEFFQPGFSKFAYNNSNAQKFFPKSKEEALEAGYFWNDTENPTSKCTIKAEALPDTIKETDDKILDEVIECSNCERSYKIVKGEFELLQKMNLPVPHECPKCRENARFARMTKPKMYHRQCAKCSDHIYTPYAPEDPRIVYCVKDYQALFA